MGRSSRIWLGLIALACAAGAPPAAALTIESGKSAAGAPLLLLQGPIVSGDTARFKAALAKAGPVSAFVLNSPGGAVAEARDMGRLIRRTGAGTIVPGNAVCASACFILFAAGRTKLVEPGAMVGVHSASVRGGNENMDTLGVTTLMAREAAAYGVPSAITGRMVTTAPGKMAWLTPAELRSMGVQIAERSATGAGGVGEPGSPGGAPSDWTHGFEQGRAQGAGIACTPPAGIADPGDWSLGCASGQRSATAAVAVPRPAQARGAGPAPSDWSQGFDHGRASADNPGCDAPPATVANKRDWTVGCESGSKGGRF